MSLQSNTTSSFPPELLWGPHPFRVCSPLIHSSKCTRTRFNYVRRAPHPHLGASYQWGSVTSRINTKMTNVERPGLLASSCSTPLSSTLQPSRRTSPGPFCSGASARPLHSASSRGLDKFCSSSFRPQLNGHFLGQVILPPWQVKPFLWAAQTSPPIDLYQL